MAELSPPFSRYVALRDLNAAVETRKSSSATTEECAEIAALLELLSLETLDLTYSLRSEGEDGWRLKGQLRAAVQQACVVTLEPVPAKIDEAFTRLFTPDAADPFAEPAADIDLDLEDEDPPEPLGNGIDVGVVALETLSLSLDPYPRAPKAEFSAITAQPKGAEPITDESLKPFAGLAALKKSMDDAD